MFQASVQIQSVKTLAEGGLAINLHTQEIPADEMAMLMGLRGKQFWAAFKEVEVKAEEIEVQEVALEGKYKSPSQQLRAVLYRLWQQSGSAKVWDEWYIIQMGKIIEKMKEQLQ